MKNVTLGVKRIRFYRDDNEELLEESLAWGNPAELRAGSERRAHELADQVGVDVLLVDGRVYTAAPHASAV